MHGKCLITIPLLSHISPVHSHPVLQSHDVKYGIDVMLCLNQYRLNIVYSFHFLILKKMNKKMFANVYNINQYISE